MASWTDISDAVLAIDQPVRSIDHIALRENVIAAFEKAPGAPVLADGYVVEAMLASAAVSQPKLKTAVQTVAASTSSGIAVLSGGRYCFLPTGHQAGGDSNNYVVWSVTGAFQNKTPTNVPAAYNLNGASVVHQGSAEVCLLTYNIVSGLAPLRVQYIQASPPYDLGDGDVPLFVFVKVDKSGNVIAVSSSEDPPWANNGPTEIRPEVLVGGKPFRLKRPSLASVRDGQGRGKAIAEIRAFARTRERLERERGNGRRMLLRWLHDHGMLEPVDQERKQRDMPLVPQPFSVEPGETVVMLGLTDELHELAELDRHGESIASLIVQGYYRIDNVPAARRSPPGVMPVLGRWK